MPQAIMSSIPAIEHPIVEDGAEGAHNEDATHRQVKHEKSEMSVITISDAIVDPWTVVVHLQHTTPAHATMVSTCWLQSVTMPALLWGWLIQFLSLLVNGCLVKFWRQARIHCHGFPVVVERVNHQEEPQQGDS